MEDTKNEEIDKKKESKNLIFIILAFITVGCFTLLGGTLIGNQDIIIGGCIIIIICGLLLFTALISYLAIHEPYKN